MLVAISNNQSNDLAKFQYAQAITRTTEIWKRLPVVRYKVVSKQVYSVKEKIVSRT